MKLNEEKFNQISKRHKKLLTEAWKTNNKDLIQPIINTGEELAIVYSKGKCEKCGSTEKLQIHHLIMKYVKNYTDFWKYETQRIYWANLIVLCRKCHWEAHGFSKTKDQDIKNYIDEKKIKKIMEKYFEEFKMKDKKIIEEEGWLDNLLNSGNKNKIRNYVKKLEKNIEKFENWNEKGKNNFCYICGNKDITIHHMRMSDINSKKNKKGKNKKGQLKGIIPLCEECHQIVEDIVNKGKSKKIWYQKGYEDAQKNFG